jgi:hypothetical protein
MTQLPALLASLPALALQLLLRAVTRQLPTLLTRQRRIRRRRHRTVARGAVHLPLELLDPLLQPRHLLHRPDDLTGHVKQPDHQLARRFPASQRDRFRLRSIHDRNIPSIQKESCSPPRHHLNAYGSLGSTSGEVEIPAAASLGPAAASQAGRRRRSTSICPIELSTVALEPFVLGPPFPRAEPACGFEALGRLQIRSASRRSDRGAHERD